MGWNYLSNLTVFQKFLNVLGIGEKQTKFIIGSCKMFRGGVDNCGEYEIEYEHLTRLLNDCETVLKDPEKASKKIPTRSGCFFGNTEYNEWYLDQLKATVDIITPLLKEAKDYNGKKYLPETIIYQSSW